MNLFSRFLLINFYAILLFLLGTVGFLLSFLLLPSFYCFIPLPLCIFLLSAALKIFSAWPHKNENYRKLVEKNRNEIKLHTFRPLMSAPCGRLVARCVLLSLGEGRLYAQLKVFRPSLRQQFRENCRTQKTVIYISKDFKS